MPTTPLGLVYPDSSGHTRVWEHMQLLALSADSAIAAQQAELGLQQVQAGAAVVTLTAVSFNTAAVTFPVPFAAAPTVVCHVMSGLGAAVGATTLVTVLSATGFTVRLTLTGVATASFTVDWVAIL